MFILAWPPGTVQVILLAASSLHLPFQPRFWLLRQQSEKGSVILPAAGPFPYVVLRSACSQVPTHLLVPTCLYTVVLSFQPRLQSASLSLCLHLSSSSAFFLRLLWRETAISHVPVNLTMLLVVALALVFSFTVVTAERAENTNHKPPAPLLNYSRISLPPEHVPRYLYNNKRVAKQCRLDPLCPFKVRYALCRLFIVQICL